MSSLAATMESASLNEADVTNSSLRPQEAQAPAKPAKTIAVLPSSQEIGLRTKPTSASSKPQYQPMQWGGVAAMHEEAFESSSPGPLKPTVASTTNVPAKAHAKENVQLPSAREIGLPPKPTAKSTANHNVQEWKGISSSMFADDYVHQPSPETVRRASKSNAQTEGQPEAEAKSADAYPVNIPSAQEIGLPVSGRSSAIQPVRRHSISGPSLGITNSSWSGVSGFSDHADWVAKQSPSPPARHATSKPKATETTEPPAVSLPSSAELALGPSAFRPISNSVSSNDGGRSRTTSYDGGRRGSVGSNDGGHRSRTASYETYSASTTSSTPKWSGVSAALAD